MFDRSIYVAVMLPIVALCGIVEFARAEPATAQPSPEGVAAHPGEPCVEVQIGRDRAGLLECLNEQFRRSAEGQRAVQPAAPYGTSSPPSQIGLFNETAERERLGNAFGGPPPVKLRESAV
jgi:hypothetical protein